MSQEMTSSGVQGVHQAVVNIVAARTLYDDSYLQPESHFEGELGIDSVVLESILASVKEHFDLQLPLQTKPNTLRELVCAVESAVSKDSERPSEMLHEGGGVLEAVLGATMRQTQYPRESLDLEANLEADLGIDSVVLTSIVSDVVRELNLPSVVSRDLTAATLRELVLKIESRAASSEQSMTFASPTHSERGPQKNKAEDPRPEDPRPEENKDLAHILARHGLSYAAETSFDVLGLSEEQKKSLLDDVEQTLGVRQLFRMEDCENLEQLLAYVNGVSAVCAAKPVAKGLEEGWDDRSMKDFMEERDSDLFAKTRSFGSYLKRRQEEHLYWYGMPLHSRCANRSVIFDELTGTKREFLMFASNNYLGLANHPKVIQAICDATGQYGATNTGCRLIGGTNLLHKELERRLAAFKGRPACILYPGGYSANLGCISALVKSYDALVVDKLNHMSIVDGCKLSGGVRKIYQHEDMADLERVLERCDDHIQGKLIAVDGVFSMHGDVCNLPEIVRLARKYGARVLVDDAHATGVLGQRGSGTAEHYNLKGEVDLELGTLSKTLAGMGGFVVGEEEVIEYLRFYSNSYVFAANIPAGVAAGLIASLDVIEAEPERIQRLWSNIGRLKRLLLEAGFDLENSESAILPIVIGDERRAMEMGRAVRARGLFCQTVVFPGVPLGDARLRISVTSEHTVEDLEQAAAIFSEAGQVTGVLPPSPLQLDRAR